MRLRQGTPTFACSRDRIDPCQVADLCVYCRLQPVDPRWRPFCSERCQLRRPRPLARRRLPRRRVRRMARRETLDRRDDRRGGRPVGRRQSLIATRWPTRSRLPTTAPASSTRCRSPTAPSRPSTCARSRSADDDFGLMTYDPAFTNTASCRSAITYIDGDKGILDVPRLPDRAARRAQHVPRDGLPHPVRRAADASAAEGLDA